MDVAPGGEDRGVVGAGAGTATVAMVADSWLVDDGRCRGLDLHRQRFADACHRHGVAPSLVADFLDDVIAALPRAGRWFPRVEYHAGQFRLWLRPAPKPSEHVVLWVPDVVDPRTDPTVKGPDLVVLTALREAAGRVHANEAVLLSPSGDVREGALSSLMWWRGSTLCAPPEGDFLLPSVTRRLILCLAARHGQPVRFETCRPTDLDGLEVWSISALHGIRPVSRWRGISLVAGPARQAPGWQRELLSLAAPLPAPATAPGDRGPRPVRPCR